MSGAAVTTVLLSAGMSSCATKMDVAQNVIFFGRDVVFMRCDLHISIC